MKRCINCGWLNPDDAARCEKCCDDSFELEDQSLEEPVASHQEPEVSSVDSGKKVLSATIIDVSSVIDDNTVSQCPKCRYPIAGYVEYCPNCGATIRNTLASSPVYNERVPDKQHVSSRLDLKATVSEIPEEMMRKSEMFILTPIDAQDEAPIEMSVGDIVFINGRHYRFHK